MERPSVTDQLVGIGQDIVRLTRLALVFILASPCTSATTASTESSGASARMSRNPGGVPQWPCSIRTNATRRLLVAASIRASSLMMGMASRVPKDGGLKYARPDG